MKMKYKTKLSKYGILRMYPGEIYVGTKERFPAPEDFAKALVLEGDAIFGLPNNLIQFIKSGCAKWTLGYNSELENESRQGWYQLIEYDTKNKGLTPVWYIKIIDQTHDNVFSGGMNEKTTM